MSSSQHYAGDITPTEAWAFLARDPAARLVDVRTAAEWSFVGLPDLGELGCRPDLVEWQFFPDQRLNADFIRALTEKLDPDTATRDTPLLFLCRSGGRSRAAAVAMTEAGFCRAFNIAGGFEGDPDANGHRGTTNGWKAAGLPWRQS
jgi:rhodanese-related sulfurtransferase